MNYYLKARVWIVVALLAGGTSAGRAQSNTNSLHVVAYVNVSIPENQYVMLANPLNTTNNTLGGLLDGSPDQTLFLKYNQTFESYVFDAPDAEWKPDNNATLNPGEGGFYKAPVATTLTFVGEILQGSLTNTLPSGQYVIRSSMVPQAATPTVLGIPAEDGDMLFLFRGGGYSVYVYDLLLGRGWMPNEPTIRVAEAFWYRKSPAGMTNLWIRDFWIQNSVVGAKTFAETPNLKIIATTTAQFDRGEAPEPPQTN